MARAILTDIESTTSSIAFVKEVLFPYARRALPGFVAAHGGEPEVRRWLGAVVAETGAAGDDALIATLRGWIDQDRKHPALKALQGMIWPQHRLGHHGYACTDLVGRSPTCRVSASRSHLSGRHPAPSEIPGTPSIKPVKRNGVALTYSVLSPFDNRIAG